MTDREQLIEKLKEDGRRSYDQMQKNLTWQASRTDDEIKSDNDPLADIFGDYRNDPEGYRDQARRTQDKLDRQGRDAYAQEYAETQIKNLVV